MADVLQFSNYQDQPGAACPMYLVNFATGQPYVAGGGGGGGSTPVAPYTQTALGYQQITGLGSAQGLTVPATATFATISVTGAAVRYRDDGTAPTTSLGVTWGAGSTQTYAGPLSAIKFIQLAAGATIDVLYYK